MQSNGTTSVASGGESERARSLRKPPYPRFVGRALWAAAFFRVRQWDRGLEQLREVQERELQRILRPAAGTEFGRRHGFASIRSYDDFRRNVPTGDYDAFSPYIERMRQGERGLLVPELIRYFGNSSGSSTQGRSKFLPISERQIRAQRGSARDALYRYLVWRGEDDFTAGFTLGLLPPFSMRPEGPVFITTNPSLQYQRAPAFVRPLQLPEKAIGRMTDYDDKLVRIAERYLDHDVRAVTGTTCWFSILFDKLIAAARARGRRVSTVREIWPNLRVLLGGGVAADPYLPVIRERVGRDDVTLVDTYNATEGGIFAASDFEGGPGLRMIPDRGVFFEFVPVEDVDADAPRRVPLWEVERDRLYAIHVTTPSGLYAYRLGDLVRFPSTDPLRIEFAGRLSGCLSTTQELTTHVEVQRGMDHALTRFPGLTTVDYGAAADVGVDGTAKARYVLFVEFAGEGPSDPTSFAQAFDEGLQSANRVYREHRTDETAILPPELVVMPPGTVARFMAAVGGGNVQTKFPRILDDDKKERLRAEVVRRGS